MLASTICKLNNSLTKEPMSTQDANKRTTWILDAKYNKENISSQSSETIASF